MKKYRVTVTETCTYHVDVEAANEDSAREKAVKVMENTLTRDAYFGDCMERETGSLYSNPPNWSLSK